MVFNFSAPIISHSGIRGSTHFIRVNVIGQELAQFSKSIELASFTVLLFLYGSKVDG